MYGLTIKVPETIILKTRSERSIEIKITMTRSISRDIISQHLVRWNKRHYVSTTQTIQVHQIREEKLRVDFIEIYFKISQQRRRTSLMIHHVFLHSKKTGTTNTTLLLNYQRLWEPNRLWTYYTYFIHFVVVGIFYTFLLVGLWFWKCFAEVCVPVVLYFIVCSPWKPPSYQRPSALRPLTLKKQGIECYVFWWKQMLVTCFQGDYGGGLWVLLHQMRCFHALCLVSSSSSIEVCSFCHTSWDLYVFVNNDCNHIDTILKSF